MISYSLKLYSYNDILNHLIDLDSNNKLPSKILLSGQEGIGKSTFVFHFINYMFSKNQNYKYEINKKLINKDNQAYIHVNNLSHPNFFYISKNENKKNIEIEQIRNMINFLNKSSFNNKKKIIFLDGVENLNINSSNALLKSLEESNNQNLFLLTHNINYKIQSTIKSRCLNYHLNFDYSQISNVIFEFFGENHYDNLNQDFKNINLSPNFLINHILFAIENNMELKNLDVDIAIQSIIEKKFYKKNIFISNNFQSYIEIFFKKKYINTLDYKYYDLFLKTVSENNLINKFNLDIDSFFVKFENKYLKI